MDSITRGYYSIIQYCPDPSRLEAVNIGVALFCPEVRFLKARFGKRRTPVSYLFGKQDWELVEVESRARILSEQAVDGPEQKAFGEILGQENGAGILDWGQRIMICGSFYGSTHCLARSGHEVYRLGCAEGTWLIVLRHFAEKWLRV